MKNVCWCAIPIFVITLFVSFADARLPDDGLARAAEAEKALAAGDPQQAIAIFVELDAKYPNEPAVNLRLAEIYDQQGQLGAALFYYRRYVQLAGAKARQSAKERVQTLEMTAGAREAADAVAQKLGQRARPVGTPTPKIEQAIEKLLPDGARVRVDSPEELMSEKVNPKKLVSPTPETSQHPLARAEVIIRDGAPDGETSVPAVVKKTPRAIFTPPPLTSFSSGENQEAKTQSGGTVKESVTPEPIWETPATPRATEKASAAAPPGEPTQLTQNKISVEFAPAERTAFEKAKHPTQSEVAGSSKPSGSPAVSSPTPVRLLANEPGKFFICHPFGGDVARLSLSNELPNAVLVLSALPVLGGDPVNAIVGGGETRSYDVRPGRYVVHVTIRDNSYPPVTLLDTRFDYEFQQGINYARRFSPRDIEGRALRP
ncbi:MAG: tetratricopeptide repeat protein [Candidatus Sumerlaeaceae bacterium]|nr:tetratricopeptide repeat protein [Candidatus Sumerlaeaceae bacterium]